jgi:hypothetical protein
MVISGKTGPVEAASYMRILLASLNQATLGRSPVASEAVVDRGVFAVGSFP